MQLWLFPKVPGVFLFRHQTQCGQNPMGLKTFTIKFPTPNPCLSAFQLDRDWMPRWRSCRTFASPRYSSWLRSWNARRDLESNKIQFCFLSMIIIFAYCYYYYSEKFYSIFFYLLENHFSLGFCWIAGSLAQRFASQDELNSKLQEVGSPVFSGRKVRDEFPQAPKFSTWFQNRWVVLLGFSLHFFGPHSQVGCKAFLGREEASRVCSLLRFVAFQKRVLIHSKRFWMYKHSFLKLHR